MPASDSFETVVDALRAGADAGAENPLLMVPARLAEAYGEPAVRTYGEVLAEAERLSRRYAAAGYGHGHRVALLLENRPSYYVHWFALNALGVSIVPINPDYRSEETTYLLEHSEVELVVALSERHAALAAVAQTTTKPPSVVAPDALDRNVPGPTAPPPRESRPDHASECALLYTSGTTGRPKGCILSNEYFLEWGRAYGRADGLAQLRTGRERLMTPLPTFHVNAIGHSFMGMLLSRNCQVILDRFHPRSWWADALETGATCFHFLGVMPAILLGLAPGDEERRHALRFGLGGGMDPEHHVGFEARFGCPLLEGWAMTELGGTGAFLTTGEPRHVGAHCMGRRPAHLDVRLVDDQGCDVAAGTPGEMLIRRAGAEPRRGFFSGYLKDAAATEAAWDGGWFHTGDLVRLGTDGSYHFVDRKKNIIRRSGENIAPVEVEIALMKCPAVAQAAVIAAPDDVRGDEVLACVVPAAGVAADAVSAERIQDWCLERLAYYKAPGYVVFMDALPTTATQKVQKAALAGLGIDPRTRPGAFDLRPRKRRPRAETRG